MDKRDFSILIIDDHKHIRRLLEYTLDQMGFTIYTAENGLIGLKLTCKKKPDLILLDCMMPKMNGFEYLEKAKLNDDIKNIPVIMFTAKGMVRDMEQAFELGADDYIVKPFEMEKFKRKLEKFL